ncbi:pectinacetylesterase family protein [Pseudenhygromyxa sp. WMMC2535]|uniref:pectinacetylesterase family protein n=1 Tax=Pseudenhygromyxa sp. WMMC2535 TaxID=2712867 RepID=UPI0020D14256|nr:pectinacetylesterase family protein [Pseudenhygromyxa sp. WMMC2535]
MALAVAGCDSDADFSDSSEETAGETASGETESEDTGESTDTGADTGAQTEDSETTGQSEPVCGDGVVDAGEACDDGNDDDFDGCLSDCSAVELLAPPALEWTYFEIPGTQCMNGSTAGFAVNYNPDSPDVMIYLEGGGACFSDGCDFMSFNIPYIPPSDGIFSRSNAASPVKDWTMIYVPYCTGDIHAGDAEAELGGQLRQFRGYSNIGTFLQQWVPSFPAERVLLTGISAGGFGAALNSTQVADAYGAGVDITVIDDSGPPLSDEVIPPCLQTLFRDTWNLDGTVLAECASCDPNDFATGFLEHALSNYPDMKFGVFSNTSDAIISAYMGAGWGNGQWNNCGGLSTSVPALTYAEDLLSIRALNEDRMSTFYPVGIGHTVLRVGYNITSVGGTSVPEWIGQVIDGDIVHVGP